MKTADFAFELPAELIAQEPLPERSASRLLTVEANTAACSHLTFRDLPQLLTAVSSCGRSLKVRCEHAAVFASTVRSREADRSGNGSCAISSAGSSKAKSAVFIDLGWDSVVRASGQFYGAP